MTGRIDQVVFKVPFLSVKRRREDDPVPSVASKIVPGMSLDALFVNALIQKAPLEALQSLIYQFNQRPGGLTQIQLRQAIQATSLEGVQAIIALIPVSQDAVKKAIQIGHGPILRVLLEKALDDQSILAASWWQCAVENKASIEVFQLLSPLGIQIWPKTLWTALKMRDELGEERIGLLFKAYAQYQVEKCFAFLDFPGMPEILKTHHHVNRIFQSCDHLKTLASLDSCFFSTEIEEGELHSDHQLSMKLGRAFQDLRKCNEFNVRKRVLAEKINDRTYGRVLFTLSFLGLDTVFGKLINEHRCKELMALTISRMAYVLKQVQLSTLLVLSAKNGAYVQPLQELLKEITPEPISIEVALFAQVPFETFKQLRLAQPDHVLSAIEARAPLEIFQLFPWEAEEFAAVRKEHAEMIHSHRENLPPELLEYFIQIGLIEGE